MANADVKEDGIYAWMTSVRASMANDPCRQLFEDQVQTHAFIFLDDYLEHILAGPKQGPMVELVKTPGRKKNVLRKTRAATAAAAKVKSTSLFSLDGDTSTHGSVPVNSFHKALLQVKERSALGALALHKHSIDSLSVPDSSAEQAHGQSDLVQAVEIPEITVSSEPESQAGPMPIQCRSSAPKIESTLPCLTAECGTELSVIVEGDESPERSPANILPVSIIAVDRVTLSKTTPLLHEAGNRPATEDKSNVVQAGHESHESASPDVWDSVPLSIDTYHSIPLASSREVQSSETCLGSHTEPLPSQTTIHSPRNHEKDVSTAPLPVVPASNSALIPHTISVPLNDSSPRTLAHKSGTPGFPTLPAPSPLRKSIRITQETSTGSAFPFTAPALVPLGKRTSWLMKAREAKAMEGTSSVQGNPVNVVPAIPRVSTAVKRKSEEMLDAVSLGPDSEKDQHKPKIARSTEGGTVPRTFKVAEKSGQRSFPSAQAESTAVSSIVAAISMDQSKFHAMDVDEQVTPVNCVEDGFIDLFKRTVEGLGTRSGKSMRKSLGGAAAAAALAEARAAAEAKVAERNKSDSESRTRQVLHDVDLVEETKEQSVDQSPFVLAPQAEGTECQSSSLDLVPETAGPNEPELSSRTTRAMEIHFRISSDNESTSTTPPDSPPLKRNSGFVKPTGPVFNKPPPVFMPPASKQSPFNFPPGHRTLPVAVSLGIPVRLPSPFDAFPHADGTTQMSVQPPQPGTSTGLILDRPEGAFALPPSVQDVHSIVNSQPSDMQCTIAVAIDDDDDSWPLEEKLAATAEPGWRPFDFSNVDKEDTWSSLPTESQGPTRSLVAENNGDAIHLPSETDVETEANNEVEWEHDPADLERSITEGSELEMVTEAMRTSLDRAEPTARGTSQTSVASTASSSHSQTGFFSHATKLVNTMLGGSKKSKPELKSLQLAAVAAKRQQEEADKKTQRLKDMETRRQVAIARKAEEERTRLLEEEKKSKEELEKRKREREENTRPLKPPASTKKAEDDTFKKRKPVPETEKKLENKKHPPPSTKSAVTPTAKIAAQKGAKTTTTALVSSAAYNTTQNAAPVPSAKLNIPEAKPFKVVSSSLKGKAKAKPQEDDPGDKLPSTIVQSQMAARAKAQMQAAKLPTPEVPSESIELPEINSEYSDSEDEDRIRTFVPPDWAQSPELRQALQMQSTVNPDGIFGTIPPLRMDEMFRTRQSRFRARTSSANWSGPDRLTVEEIHEYERRMGFQ